MCVCVCVCVCARTCVSTYGYSQTLRKLNIEIMTYLLW